MATNSQILDFLSRAVPAAQNGYKTLGKVLPSVAVGMACVECAYGTAGSVKHHSYLGQKVGTGKTATKYWGGKFFTSSTKEEYKIGVHTTINAAFRAYDSIEQCFLNYYELLNTSLYAKVLPGVDYKTQMQQIKACGYMTSSTEVNSVCTIIQKYDLTWYDTVNGKVDAAPRLGEYAVDAYALNIRPSAGTAGESVGQLRKGSSVNIDEIKDGWGHFSGGWVSMKYVT